MKKTAKLYTTKVVERNVTKIETTSVKQYNWDLIPVGSKFTAYIDDTDGDTKPTQVSGRIQKEDGRIYLCQNNHYGEGCKNKLGYKCSWNIGDGLVEYLDEDYQVTDLEITLDPKFKYVEPEVIDLGFFIKSYKPEVSKDEVKVGCTTVPFDQIEQIYNAMCYLKSV